MSVEDKYARNRPQRLKNPYRPIGWAMLVRGIVVVAFGFWELITMGAELKAARFDVAFVQLIFGFIFIAWGGRAIARGTAIALRFGVRQSAPSDLSPRMDPQTGQPVGYGVLAYTVSDLRNMFLRKELPSERHEDLIDQLLSLLGGKQPKHPLKRELTIDILRGTVTSALLLGAFVVAFGVVQFDAAMKGQSALLNLVFLVAFVVVLQYWGVSRSAGSARQSVSLGKLLFQIGLITVVAVTLPIGLGFLGPVAALFARISIPSPFDLLIMLVTLGLAAVVLTMLIVWTESSRFADPDTPSVAISESQPGEIYGRLLPKDLLNAFARFVAASRSISLDDRVYSFAETRGQGGANQPSDHAEFIAESAPLIFTERTVAGWPRALLINTSVVAEILAFLAALIIFRETGATTNATQVAFAALRAQNLSLFLNAFDGRFVAPILFALTFAKFSNLFREIAFRFLGEVVFHSLMMSISISSSVVPGRHETSVSESDGAHLFDAGRTSSLRLRIQTANVQTATMVSSAGGADSLGQARYVIALQREGRLLAALAQEAYRYISDRTSAATTRVRSTTVELKDSERLLYDSGTGSAFFGVPDQAALPGRPGPAGLLPRRQDDE